MDVCFLTPAAAEVWYGRQIDAAAEMLRRRGRRVERLTVAGGCKFAYDAEPGPLGWVRWARRLRERRPQLIHLWSRRPRTDLLAAIAAVGAPRVVASHRCSKAAPSVRLARKLRPQWRWLRHGLGGVADVAFEPKHGLDRAALRREWGIPENARVALVVDDGDFSGALDAVWLAAQFGVLDDDLHVVVGSVAGAMRASRMQRRLEVYAQRAEVNDRIAWVSAPAEELVHGADVVVQFSVRDAAGFLLAAAAGGRPLVAADSILNRTLIDDGRTGWLIRPRNVTDASRRVLRLLETPYVAERFVAAAREEVARSRPVAQALVPLEAIYDELSPGSRLATDSPSAAFSAA